MMTRRILAALAAIVLTTVGGLSIASPAQAACVAFPPMEFRLYDTTNCNGPYTITYDYLPDGSCVSLHPPTYVPSWANRIASFKNQTGKTYMLYVGPVCTGERVVITGSQGASSLQAPWLDNVESYRIIG